VELPTVEELRKALEKYERDGPQPVAASIDASPELSAMVRGQVEVLEEMGLRNLRLSDIVKSGMTLGLNLGIRIGEARGRAGLRADIDSRRHSAFDGALDDPRR
jgi:hypothetical protein